jgi:hypothetical protein
MVLGDPAMATRANPRVDIVVSGRRLGGDQGGLWQKRKERQENQENLLCGLGVLARQSVFLSLPDGRGSVTH